MKLDSRHKSGISLQGNLAVIELSSIFQFFDYATVSGELRVVAEQNNASFFFNKGVLIFGSLSFNRKRIGDMLVDSSLITAEQLTQCLRIHSQQGKKRKLGDILVRQGFVKFEELADLLQDQAREAFFESLSWKRGMFFFYANQHPAKEEILINERIDHLLLAGLVRMDDDRSNAENQIKDKEIKSL